MSRESNRSFARIASILDVLGSTDTLKIFDEAAKGFKSGKEIIKKLRLTPRKYYRDLRKLNDLGIVAASEGLYNLTPVGKYLHRLLLNDALTFLSTDPKLLDVFQRIGHKSDLRVIYDYRDLIELMNAAIEKSNSEILIASRYLDLSVTQSLLYALQRGVELKSVSNEKLDLSSLMRLLSTLIRVVRPNFVKLYLDKPDYRVGEVLVSFMIIDDEICIFELPSKEFKIAFLSNDKKVAELLSDLFREIWNRSQRLHLFKG